VRPAIQASGPLAWRYDARTVEVFPSRAGKSDFVGVIITFIAVAEFLEV
jgi:hypothetical protein